MFFPIHRLLIIPGGMEGGEGGCSTLVPVQQSDVYIEACNLSEIVMINSSFLQILFLLFSAIFKLFHLYLLNYL